MIAAAQSRHLDAIVRELPDIVAAMRATGNDQWGPAYPTAEHFAADLAAGHLFVDVEQGAVRGFGVFNEIEPEQYNPLPWTVPRPALVIHRLAVCPAFRRQGVADGLFAYAETLAGDKGLGQRSDTSTRNPAMNALFEKRGWRFVGTLEFPGRETGFRAWEKPLQ
jgi:GNAT superfamily N-acetyltransferase